MTVSLIWAQAANGVIGDRGRLPWHLPEDLALFRRLTMGGTVVMGRATWESLPASVRPLPGRRNVVLSRRPRWSAPGAVVAGSLDAALEQAAGAVWVIGGSSVYASALDRATRIVRTELDHAFDGDACAPPVGERWVPVEVDPAQGWRLSGTGLRFRVVTLERAPRGGAPQPGTA
ncbi:MAG: dihydrofolate reductase [Frankiaceae bacterium]